MLLGDLLANVRRAALLLDPELRQAITERGEMPETFARAAVAAFERSASAEEWTTLLGTMQRAADPAAACLAAMVRRHLRALPAECGPYDER